MTLSTKTMCDCELGHNGMGMSIRECDCEERRRDAWDKETQRQLRILAEKWGIDPSAK